MGESWWLNHDSPATQMICLSWYAHGHKIIIDIYWWKELKEEMPTWRLSVYHNAMRTSVKVSYDTKSQSFMLVHKSRWNLLPSKPSSYRMRRNFVVELWNLSGNYWRCVDLQNVLWILWLSCNHLIVTFTVNVSNSSKVTSNTIQKALIYTWYQNNVTTDYPVSS